MHPVDASLCHLHALRGTGAAVPETAAYGTLETLRNAIGQTLTPRVRGVTGLKDEGAGLPDGRLFTPD